MDKEIEIHGFKVKYDSSSQTLKNAIKFLQEKLEKEEARVYFDTARRDLINYKCHLEVRNSERDRDDNLTLLYRSDEGYYRLRKRSYEH